MEKIRIAIADDHPMVVEGLESYFSKMNDLEVVFTTNKASMVDKMVDKFKPDLLFLDYSFSGEELNGLTICKNLIESNPCTRIVIISSYKEYSIIKSFIDLGISGYISKTASQNDFRNAVLQVYAGGNYYGNEISELLVANKLNKPDESLSFTKTEKKIIHLISKGNSSKDIAKILCREKSTIDTHRKNILVKFHALDKSAKKVSKNISFYISKFKLQDEFNEN